MSSLVRPCLILASQVLLLLGASAHAQSEYPQAAQPATQYSGQSETTSRTPQPVTTTREASPIPPMPRPTDAQSRAGAGVDTTMAWAYIRGHDTVRAREEIARLRQENPGWAPPPDMQDALARDDIDRSRASRDVGIHGLAAGPAIVAARDAAGATALGWLEFKAGRMREAGQWFGLALRWTGSEDALKGAVLVAGKLGRLRDVDALVAEYGKKIPPDMNKILGDIYAGAASKRAPHDLAGASDDARKASAHGNDSGWTSVGWALLNAGRPGDAVQAFLKAPATDASATTGRALALMRAGDLAGARRLACRDGRALKAGPCGDVLVASADRAYKAGQWLDARAIADQAQKLGVENRGLSMEDGWSAYHLGQYDDAARIFEALYDAHPDRDAADGLVTALRAGGRDSEAARLALGKGGALAASYGQAKSAADYARKQFLAAEDWSPGAYPALSNVGSAALGGGIAYRSRSGAPGQDSVSAVSENVSGTDSFGRNTLDARIENTTMDIGTAHPGDPVGSVTGLWAVKPTSSANLVTPDARWRYQGDISYEMDLGMTPLNGDIGAHPVGGGSITFNGDRSGLTGAVFSQTRWDSLLSAAGMVDPVTGTHWGRVTETGAQVDGWLGLGGNWSVSGRALGSALSGDQVEDNNRIALSAAIDYTLKPEGFDYVRLGPTYNFESYERNLDHFTLGNGGYYSPQSLNAPALAVEFLTQEGKRWQFWGRADAGLNFQSESASPYFPLAGGGGPSFASSTSSGVAGDLAAKVSYLVSENWIADAYAWTSLAPNYSETVVGLGLSYSFEPRKAVVSSDLPDYIGQSRY